jgi:peptidyl-prolyl cis-trans isomerase B (cyclophilin B)
MTFRLSDACPKHKSSFLKMIDEKKWEGQDFNRLVKDFVIQAGCADLEDGSIQAEYWIDAEIVDSLGHQFGALGMGRDNNASKKSANCQFYIVSNEKGVHRLDGDYTIFGQLIDGQDVLKKINMSIHSNTDSIEDLPFQISRVELDESHSNLDLYR